MSAGVNGSPELRRNKGAIVEKILEDRENERRIWDIIFHFKLEYTTNFRVVSFHRFQQTPFAR